jgi:hypothetical protein
MGRQVTGGQKKGVSPKQILSDGDRRRHAGAARRVCWTCVACACGGTHLHIATSGSKVEIQNLFLNLHICLVCYAAGTSKLFCPNVNFLYFSRAWAYGNKCTGETCLTLLPCWTRRALISFSP